MAVSESIFSNLRHAFGDSDGGESVTTLENTDSNARYAFGKVDGGEVVAARESIISYTRYVLGEVDGGKFIAFVESIVSNVRYILRESYIGKLITTRESVSSDTRHALWDDSLCTACYYGVTACFYDGIAFFTRVVYSVLLSHGDFCETIAAEEYPLSNPLHIFWYSDGGEAVTNKVFTTSYYSIFCE